MYMEKAYPLAIRFVVIVAGLIVSTSCMPETRDTAAESGGGAMPVTTPNILFILAAKGVRITSLAPRFVGLFEKGVDYRGDIEAFKADFAEHVSIARTLGPYKLSVHSGSDKYSIYPLCHEMAGDLLHVKTAGTSFLEEAFLKNDDADDPRQVLHVAFGQVLQHASYGPILREMLSAHPEEHIEDLVRHFSRHLTAFGAEAIT
jgi:hypothetical protein